jgi:hypothetical protein
VAATKPGAESATSPDGKKDATRNVAKISGPHLIVYYAEVPRPVLARIIDASRNTGQFMSFNDYTAGILPGIDQRMDATGVKILHREDRPIDSGKTLQWFYGLKDRRNPNVEIGLTTFFELADIDTNNMRGENPLPQAVLKSNANPSRQSLKSAVVQDSSCPASCQLSPI